MKRKQNVLEFVSVADFAAGAKFTQPGTNVLRRTAHHTLVLQACEAKIERIYATVFLGIGIRKRVVLDIYIVVVEAGTQDLDHHRKTKRSNDQLDRRGGALYSRLHPSRHHPNKVQSHCRGKTAGIKTNTDGVVTLHISGGADDVTFVGTRMRLVAITRACLGRLGHLRQQRVPF